MSFDDRQITATYSELINYTVDKIKAQCCNIDRYVPPPALQYGGTGVFYDNSSYAGGQGRVTGYTECALQTTQVSRQQVYDKLVSFLQSRGIFAREGTIITSKGMLNYFNNAASFVNSHVKLYVAGNNTSASFFILNGTGYNPVNLDYTQENITMPEAQQNVTDLMRSIANVNNTFMVNMHLRFASCCCSSSSCSSSSSSAFIAYMKI